MFQAAKDTLASRAAQAWVGKLLARYGEVQSLTIDSRKKVVEITCLLRGEATPITIRIENYIVETERNEKFIRATGFRCSRPWLESLLIDHGPRQRVALPAWAAAAL